VGESKFIFEAKTIQRMELLVLSTLKWRMQSITPFTFLDYFLYKINGYQSPLKSSVMRSIQLISSTAIGIDLFLPHTSLHNWVIFSMWLICAVIIILNGDGNLDGVDSMQGLISWNSNHQRLQQQWPWMSWRKPKQLTQRKQFLCWFNT